MAPRKTTRRSKDAAKSNEEVFVVKPDDLNNDQTDQIEYYKKQIVLLQQELESCKNLILELQSENKILKNSNISALNNDAIKISLNQRNVNDRLKNNKVLSPSPIAKLKGCSCKGNCSNKICGCVKKGNQCSEFCRCNDAQCQNQEPDKENVQQAPLTIDGQKALEKLGSLTLTQETLHASEKKIKKSIFSPFVGRSFHNGNEGNYPTSPLVFETRRKLFSQDSDDLVDINASEHDKDELANKLENEPPVSIKSPTSKRTRKLKNSEKTEATATNVKHPESVLLKELKRVQQTEQDDTKKNNNEHKPVIVVHNNEENNEDEIFVSNEQLNIPKSPRVLRRKSKSTSPESNVVKRKYNRPVKQVKAKSVSPKESMTNKNDSENKQPKLGKVQHSPQPSIKQNITSIKNVENIDNEEDDKLINKIESSKENSVGNSQSFDSNTSGNTSNSSNHHELVDSTLNPMVPKRQLARSPITAGTVIISVDKKRFSPPAKMELTLAEIDWDQHQSELVQCKKCKRKFFPHRIDKHMTSCKGI